MEMYFDNSATTKVLDEVVNVMTDCMRNDYGNPSSMHRMGLKAEQRINASRNIIASALNVSPDEIIFTSGGTESNNIAIKGSTEANARRGKHIITSKVEHPSVLNVFKYMQDNGYDVDYIGVSKEGIVDIDDIKDAVKNETAFVSIMYVNNETGVIQPIEEISKIIKNKNANVIFHVDAVQAFGKLPIDLKKLNVDLLSVSSHKIHGPKGVGALYIKNGTKFSAGFLGGGQEMAVRSGTENVPGICGFGVATDLIKQEVEASASYVLKLKELFINGLREEVKDFVINPHDITLCSPYIVNISFPGVRAEVLLHSLEQENIYVSTGSACSARRIKHSPVLKEMGLSKESLDGAIRVSFSRFNTSEQVLFLIEKLSEIVPQLRLFQRR